MSASTAVRVLLVEDEPGERRLVREMLAADLRVLLVGECDTAEGALEQVGVLLPDVVLMDVKLPGTDGIVATRLIKELAPDVHVVALTGADDDVTVRSLIEAGASGYLLKGAQADTIVQAIVAARSGEAVLSPQVARRMLDDLVVRYRAERARADELSSALRMVSEALSGAMEARDATTATHSSRAASLATHVLAELDPDAAADPATEFGFLLHDVGKIAVPDAVLLKPGPLDEEEWRQMRQHPVWGAQILTRVPMLARGQAIEIVRHHHERWDGKGYPDGLAGLAIPSGCRAFAAVDTFDAMTSNRPYRNAMSMQEAMDEIRRHRGTQFDPDAVDIFISVIDRMG